MTTKTDGKNNEFVVEGDLKSEIMLKDAIRKKILKLPKNHPVIHFKLVSPPKESEIAALLNYTETEWKDLLAIVSKGIDHEPSNKMYEQIKRTVALVNERIDRAFICPESGEQVRTWRRPHKKHDMPFFRDRMSRNRKEALKECIKNVTGAMPVFKVFYPISPKQYEKEMAEWRREAAEAVKESTETFELLKELHPELVSNTSETTIRKLMNLRNVAIPEVEPGQVLPPGYRQDPDYENTSHLFKDKEAKEAHDILKCQIGGVRPY